METNNNEIQKWEIAGHILEYIDDIHQYLVDGVCVPSITQILKIKFGNKYDKVDTNILKKAAEKGTKVHEAIEKYEKLKIEDNKCKELYNYKFLKKQYKFECLDNEVPIILFKNGIPIAGGRLDLVLKKDSQIGLGDIKRTSVLDKDYLAYQLNLYRIGYFQSYGLKAKFIVGIHLREKVRKYVKLPINEEMAMQLVNEFLERQKYERNGISS